MKIIVFGGSGFVGRSLLKYFAEKSKAELVSVSRSGRPQKLKEGWADSVKWIESNPTVDDRYQAEMKDADWVIDAIGILTENKKAGRTFENSSLMPAVNIINFIADNDLPTKFVFTSAAPTPLFLKKYHQIKIQIENYAKDHLADRSFVLRPNLIYDKSRRSTYYPAIFLNFLAVLPILDSFFKKFAPIKRDLFAKQVFDLVFKTE